MTSKAFGGKCSIVESKGIRLSPEKLGVLAKRLAAAKNPEHAARFCEPLARGFNGR